MELDAEVDVVCGAAVAGAHSPAAELESADPAALTVFAVSITNAPDEENDDDESVGAAGGDGKAVAADAEEDVAFTSAAPTTAAIAAAATAEG